MEDVSINKTKIKQKAMIDFGDMAKSDILFKRRDLIKISLQRKTPIAETEVQEISSTEADRDGYDSNRLHTKRREK